MQQCFSSECKSCPVCWRARCVSRLLHCLLWEAGDTFTAGRPLPPPKVKKGVEIQENLVNRYNLPPSPKQSQLSAIAKHEKMIQ